MAAKTDSRFVQEAAVAIFSTAGLAGHSVTGAMSNQTKTGAKPALDKTKYSVLSAEYLMCRIGATPLRCRHEYARWPPFDASVVRRERRSHTALPPPRSTVEPFGGRVKPHAPVGAAIQLSSMPFSGPLGSGVHFGDLAQVGPSQTATPGTEKTPLHTAAAQLLEVLMEAVRSQPSALKGDLQSPQPGVPSSLQVPLPGASVSLFSEEVMAHLHWRSVRIRACSTAFHLASDTATSCSSVRLFVRWENHVRRQRFVHFLGLSVALILGRDFLALTGIVIDVASGGYRAGPSGPLQPFTTLPLAMAALQTLDAARVKEERRPSAAAPLARVPHSTAEIGPLAGTAENGRCDPLSHEHCTATAVKVPATPAKTPLSRSSDCSLPPSFF
ncbi:hypothetical protein HPB49_025372 [Dermacentor silvarum]|uniref:Uncharacterized protein n=1 Tax=Dermacentor silvarum TaxID=543639 RepID=A0ACB8DSA7_DERSI|nr:hypothetical protein HPB49_025372 [Dermacentor silvarum]